ncbi:MAG: hypothetical protein NWE93_13400 [Candidatus Bathyarchaeota archaeon]|nr:hypothetical protein [Candidatus Bathyarchaeota archaeon]
MLNNSRKKGKPKSKAKATQIIPAVILICCAVGALYFSGFFDDFAAPSTQQGTSDDTANTLTPMRDLVGTWKTAVSTKFTIATDYEAFDGLSDVGSEDRSMTWTITATGEENIVLGDVAFSYSNRQLTSDSGYTPDVSPMQLRGIVNGTQLTLIRGDSGPIRQVGSVGEFTFTTHQMEGTWHDHWSGVYEQNVYTSANVLKLQKQ